MADNIELDAGSGGATLATDDIGGTHYQIIKLAHGALDSATIVSTASGLPVQMQGTWNVTNAGTFATQATLQAGTAEIGKLAAGVAEIGNVKNAGTFVVQEDGAALTALQLIDNIVLAEDVAHSDGDAGVQMLAVRKATPADLSGADGDYEPLQLDNGRLWASALITGDALTALQLIDNIVLVEDTEHSSGDSGVMALAVRNDALAALAGTDGDYAPVQVNAEGAVYTRPAASPTGGCKMFTSVDLDQTEEDPTSGPTTIYGIYAWNLTAAPLWLQLFNTNTVTVGTTAPTNNFMIPANADSDGAGVVIPIPVCGLAYDTALTVAITTGSGTDNGAPGAGDAGIVILYQD